MQQALQVSPVFRVYQAVLKDAHAFMLPEARQYSLGVTSTLQQFTHLCGYKCPILKSCVNCDSDIITPGKRLLYSYVI